MIHLPSFRARAAAMASLLPLLGVLTAGQALADTPPLRVLYVTNTNAVFHDFRARAAEAVELLPQHANASVSVAGETERDAFATMRASGFAADYDAVIYNFCLASNADEDMVANLIAQTRDLGVPAVLLHCTMHSFQTTAGRSGVVGGPHVAWPWARALWGARHPGEAYPTWWHFTGIDSHAHDFRRGFTVRRAAAPHPITAQLPAEWSTPSDELYRNETVLPGVTPLYSAYSVETRRDHAVAWTFESNGTPIFATTLGHGTDTTALATYQRLVANGLLWVTGHLTTSGRPAAGYEGGLATGR